MKSLEKLVRPIKRMAVVVFIDVVDSAELSNVLTYEQYNVFINDFQNVAKEVVKNNLIENLEYNMDKHRCWEASIRGDELCVILYSDVDEKLVKFYRKKDIKTAVLLAIEMKRKWLTCKRNDIRIKDNKIPIEISTGINAGFIIIGKHQRITYDQKLIKEKSAEGYTINLAKRIEGHSRNGKFSKIFVGRSVYNTLAIDFQIAFDQAYLALFKGISQTIPVYEIKSFGHVEDTEFVPKLDDNEIEIFEKAVEQNPHDLWLILDLAHQHYDKENYRDAAEKYKLALEINPGFSPAHMYLGRAYFRDFHDDEALPHLERAYQLNPDSARANNFLAVCLRRLASRKNNSGTIGTETTERHWRDYFNRALEHHLTAMRIVEDNPEKYKWAFNAYAMTLAQAVKSDALTMSPADREVALNEAFLRIKTVLDLNPQKQLNLFRHVLGYIQGVQGKLDDSEKTLMSAIDFLHKDSEVAPKKYREKIAEIYFHLGFLNLMKKTDTYKKAICEAFVGDLLINCVTVIDSEKDREDFVYRQYWYEDVKIALKADKVITKALLVKCKDCIEKERKCTGNSLCPEII